MFVICADISIDPVHGIAAWSYAIIPHGQRGIAIHRAGLFEVNPRATRLAEATALAYGVKAAMAETDLAQYGYAACWTDSYQAADELQGGPDAFLSINDPRKIELTLILEAAMLAGINLEFFHAGGGSRLPKKHIVAAIEVCDRESRRVMVEARCKARGIPPELWSDAVRRAQVRKEWRANDPNRFRDLARVRARTEQRKAGRPSKEQPNV